MNEVYVIQSAAGDEYKLEFTTEHSGLIAEHLLDQINSEGIEVVEIGLGRTKGTIPTSPLILAQIEQIIATTFLSHPNVIKYYLSSKENLNSLSDWLVIPKFYLNLQKKLGKAV